MSTRRFRSPARSFAAVAFRSVELFWLFAVGGFAWLMRDGLGPEATTSSGTAALVRMWGTFSWGPVCLAFLAVEALGRSFERRRVERGRMLESWWEPGPDGL